MIKGLKICGVSDPETLNFILNHNHKPTMIGFITNYEKSKRFVEYEKLKDLTRGNRVTKEGMQVFVENLELPEEAKDELLELTPFSYIGNAEEMAKKA